LPQAVVGKLGIFPCPEKIFIKREEVSVEYGNDVLCQVSWQEKRRQPPKGDDEERQAGTES